MYALDLDGSESYHIVTHDLNTNTCTDLTPDIAYAHQPNFSWSPDGKMLAVLRRQFNHLRLLMGAPAVCGSTSSRSFGSNCGSFFLPASARRLRGFAALRARSSIDLATRLCRVEWFSHPDR